eukprot:gnl/Spiro4/9683_TR5143_c0_g1_i1.p1 gnl/Spiro4/9683_TR5143_c0_g1~~gnl/Spiro4/9683_TR5143_c0_g1_i1.p1  ORF type:complete len:441 (+),score=156.40 gnl/Spiro4/9683_TR5143_c0_g1_i1:52-1374(+)
MAEGGRSTRPDSVAASSRGKLPALEPTSTRVQSASTNAAALATTVAKKDGETAEKQQICLDLLKDGYVQSFVDFFYLTHSTDGAVFVTESNTSPGDSVNFASRTATFTTSTDFEFLEKNLRDFEAGLRGGEANWAYETLVTLARGCEERKQFKASVIFYQKCLRVAQHANNPELMLASNRDLGRISSQIGDVENATLFHEKHLQMAQVAQSEEDQHQAYVHLVQAYENYALYFEEKGDVSKAISYFKKCLDVAKACSDHESEGKANYRLGLAHELLGKSRQAVQYYKEYLEVEKSRQNPRGEGAACSALSRAFTKLDDPKSAEYYLKQYDYIAGKCDDFEMRCEAYRSLGDTYIKQNSNNKAATYYQKYFDLAKSQGASASAVIDHARVAIGIAKGNHYMERLFAMVRDNDVAALRAWRAHKSDISTQVERDARDSTAQM